MGLDGIEILMTVEEKFQILISDNEAQKVTTPGELVDLILTKVTTSEQPSCLSSHAFYLLRRRGMDEFKLPRKAFSPNTPLDEIVPKRARKESWDSLKRALGAVVWPELCRPRPLVYGLMIAVFVVFGVSDFIIGHSLRSWNLALICALAVAVVAGWLAGLATRSFKLAFPPGYQSAGDLVHFLVARNPRLYQIEKDAWTRERAWCLVRDIIIQQTGVTDFSQDSYFVRDMRIN